MQKGETIENELALNDIAYHLPAGHRLRLSLSTAYWPMLWPSAAPLTLALDPACSHLDLPLRPCAPQRFTTLLESRPDLTPVDAI